MDRLRRITGHISGRIDPAEIRKAQIVACVRRQLELSLAKLQEMQTFLLEEMLHGLDDEKNANIKMLLSFVDRKEVNDLCGNFYALDLGGTNFRVLKLEIKNGKVVDDSAKKFKIPLHHQTGDAQGLFGFIADSVCQMASKSERAKLGFTFSFPIKQHSLNHGILVKWTKGFKTSGVVGENVVALLQRAFDAKGLQLEIVAMCNDTVGTLVTEYFNDRKASMGVILGTGSNACYWEKKKNIPKYKGPGANSEEEMAINMEWGNFDSGAVQRVLPITPFDREVDQNSFHPGQQLYEKMISGLYVSQICASIFKFYSRQNILPPLPAELPFTGWDVTTCITDKTVELSGIRTQVAKLWKVTLSTADCALLQDVCVRVTTRAARLAAMGIATVVMKMGCASGCTVSIDGSLYSKTPNFPKLVDMALTELLGSGHGVKCVLTDDGSGIGAGLIAGLTEAR